MDGIRKWLAFGTGVGIEVRDQDLQVTIVRVRRSETAVLGSAVVTDFRSRPAGEWGAELTAFLKKLGAAHIAVTVLLPRREVLVRSLNFPGVADKDLDAAIRFQIDSLHPFEEGDVYFSWTRVAKTPWVLIGISRRETIDTFSTLFAEAGLKVASFTFSTAAIYSAVRFGPTLPAGGFVTVTECGSEIEIYGESESRPAFSVTFPPIGDRAIGLAKSELRLDPETQATDFVNLLPTPTVFPASYDPSTPEFMRNSMAYATGLAGACPWLSLDANLLPEERRQGHSRVRLIPTFTLGGILLVLLTGLITLSRWADKRYLGVLQHEINRFEAQAGKVASLEKNISDTRFRTQLLDDYRRRAKHDMDAIAEITKLIPPPGWVGSMELDRQSIQIAGEAEQAAGLLKNLDNSALFEASQFTMPITRTPSGDAFRVRVMRTVVSAVPPPAAPTQSAAASIAPATIAPVSAAPYYPVQQQHVAQPPPAVVQPVLPPGFVTAPPTAAKPGAPK